MGHSQTFSIDAPFYALRAAPPCLTRRVPCAPPHRRSDDLITRGRHAPLGAHCTLVRQGETNGEANRPHVSVSEFTVHSAFRNAPPGTRHRAGPRTVNSFSGDGRPLGRRRLGTDALDPSATGSWSMQLTGPHETEVELGEWELRGRTISMR
jgi:hypothetical protein